MIAFPERANTPERCPQRIEIRRIRPDDAQPRRSFDEASLRELAESIRRYGLLSPLLVRRAGRGEYMLIAGERRLRALRMLGRETADAIVLDAVDGDCALIALIENLQREDLHFLDEAEACRKILVRQGLTQEQLAAALSKSPSALANLLRLLKLPKSVRALLREKKLSERHARALLRLSDEDAQLEFVEKSANEAWSVRMLETEIERRLQARPPQKKPIARCIRDNRLILNAINDTLRQLRRIGVRLQSRVESRDGETNVIITIRTAPE